MGVITLGTMMFLEHNFPLDRTIAHMVIVAGAGGVGLVSFAALASLLGLKEWRWVSTLIRQRLGL